MRRGFGGFHRGGFGYRRFGYPMMYRGGFGFGGGGLLTSLLAGGIGYMLGSNNANQQMPPIQQDVPSYQQPQTAPTDANTDNSMLSQLKMLSDLHSSGALTDDEFVKAKNRLFER